MSGPLSPTPRVVTQPRGPFRADPVPSGPPGIPSQLELVRRGRDGTCPRFPRREVYRDQGCPGRMSTDYDVCDTTHHVAECRFVRSGALFDHHRHAARPNDGVVVSWMAPIPTWAATQPVHWVPADASYVSRGRNHRGTISIGGWPAACGALVAPIPHDAARHECRACAEHAEHPYNNE